jgi:hypothetical protein
MHEQTRETNTDLLSNMLVPLPCIDRSQQLTTNTPMNIKPKTGN